MASFLFALVAVFTAGFGGRDQVLVARVAGRLGKGIGLLATGWISSIVTAVGMAWLGQTVAGLLPTSARTMLVALALLLGAFELFWPNRQPKPREPTRSLGALLLVLLARQWTDAARFLVFALAVASAQPWLAAVGGALGGGAALTLAWLAEEELERAPLRAIRVGVAVIFLFAAIFLGLSARGIV